MLSDSTSARLDRRRFLSGGSVAAAAIAGSWLLDANRVAWASSPTVETVDVKTACGRIRGMRQGDLSTFKGIPYAGPVSGANRFKAPPPLEPWTGVREALHSRAAIVSAEQAFLRNPRTVPV